MENTYTKITLTSHTAHQYVEDRQIKYRFNQGTVKLSYDKFNRWKPTTTTIRQGFDGIRFECETYDEEKEEIVYYTMTLNASDLINVIPALLAESSRWYA